MSERRIPDAAAIATRYDHGAAAFDERFAQNPRSVRRFARIEAPLRALASGATRLLDLGCGTGRLLGAAGIGVDLSNGLLVRAAARGRVVARADAHRLPFAAGVFDVIIAANAVFRYLDYPRAFTECARVLAPGGRLALHQYARETWSLRGRNARKSADPLHVGALAEVREPARAAGLAEERVWLWRGIRFPPYALALPERLAARFHLWDHAVFLFRRV